MPPINPTAAAAFSLWLANNEPKLFNALAARAIAQGAPRQAGGLSGFGDDGFFSSVGDTFSNLTSGIGDAVSSVAGYLTSSQGLSTLASLGSTYMTTTAQKSVVDAQVARMQAGYAPAPVQNMVGANGMVTPVYYTTTQGQIPVNAQVVSSLYPQTAGVGGIIPGAYPKPGIEKYIPWLLIGGGGLLILAMLA